MRPIKDFASEELLLQLRIESLAGREYSDKSDKVAVEIQVYVRERPANSLDRNCESYRFFLLADAGSVMKRGRAKCYF